ncbi:hypothetical protein GCM10009759_29780 [Kitasatospora saccharophila]|uniref:Uncharacterized protein n=1 Tax=Kitasatospora saccharophila TaxID=407973 RepID=A0ABN2WUQ7_9ACTN
MRSFEVHFFRVRPLGDAGSLDLRPCLVLVPDRDSNDPQSPQPVHLLTPTTCLITYGPPQGGREGTFKTVPTVVVVSAAGAESVMTNPSLRQVQAALV